MLDSKAFGPAFQKMSWPLAGANTIKRATASVASIACKCMRPGRRERQTYCSGGKCSALSAILRPARVARKITKHRVILE
jgi:hypothetical protein